MSDEAQPITVSDILFQQDPRNTNLGSERGGALLKRSISELGFGRPVLAAADGTILAGNHAMKTVEELRAEGKEFKDPLVVHTNGDRPVIHVRDDIPTAEDSRAVRMEALDNRTNELNFVPNLPLLVERLSEHDIEAEEVGYTEAELTVEPEEPETPAGGQTPGFGAGGGSVEDSYQVAIDCNSESHQREVYEQLKQLGFECRLLTL